MYTGRTVFAQVMDSSPGAPSSAACSGTRARARFRSFSCYDHLLFWSSPTDVPREPARHRDVPARPPAEVVHVGLRGRIARARSPMRTRPAIGDLRRLRADPHPARRSLYLTSPSRRVGPDRVRVRCDDDRPLPALFPWAASGDQSRGEAAHPARSASPIPTFVAITDGKAADVTQLDGWSSNRAPSTSSIALHGLRAPLRDHGSAGLLRDPGQARARLCPARLATGRQDHRAAQRSDHRPLRPRRPRCTPSRWAHHYVDPRRTSGSCS